MIKSQSNNPGQESIICWIDMVPKLMYIHSLEPETETTHFLDSRFTWSMFQLFDYLVSMIVSSYIHFFLLVLLGFQEVIKDHEKKLKDFHPKTWPFTLLSGVFISSVTKILQSWPAGTQDAIATARMKPRPSWTLGLHTTNIVGPMTHPCDWYIYIYLPLPKKTSTSHVGKYTIVLWILWGKILHFEVSFQWKNPKLKQSLWRRMPMTN